MKKKFPEKGRGGSYARKSRDDRGRYALKEKGVLQDKIRKQVKVAAIFLPDIVRYPADTAGRPATCSNYIPDLYSYHSCGMKENQLWYERIPTVV